MIDTNELNSLSVEELRAGIALQRKEIDRLRAQLASRGGVPEEVLAAVERMCLPLDQSILSGATAAADARDMATIRNFITSLATAPSPEGQEAKPEGEVVVTRNDVGEIVSVTRQDAEGRILSVIAENPAPAEGQEAATILPDGSAFAVVSTPLPENHWLYGDASKEDEHGYEPPPMPFRMATGPSRSELQDKVRAAGKYALRASTNKGKEPDLDPDAVIRNLIVGLFGYHTEDGLSSDSWANPSPVPPLMDPAEEQAGELLQTIDRTAEAGLCQMTHIGAREFLKDIRKLVAGALAAQQQEKQE